MVQDQLELISTKVYLFQVFLYFDLVHRMNTASTSQLTANYSKIGSVRLTVGNKLSLPENAWKG